MKLTLLPFPLLTLLGLTVCSTTAEDPALFFGGVDHDSYLEWYEFRGQEYFAKSLWVPSAADEDNGVALHWRVDEDQSVIHLAVIAKALGWVGFGLSENGGMRGADLMLFETQAQTTVSDALPRIRDAHVKTELMPIEDDCPSNWELDYNATTEDGFLIVEFTRALDTMDPQDRRFVKDHEYTVQPTSVIAAWGDSPTVSYHGSNRAMGSVRFFEKEPGNGMTGLELFHKKMEQEADGSFFIGAENFSVPVVETHYETFCYNITHLQEQGIPMHLQDLHIIGIEPIVDPRAKKYVHHFGVAASNSSRQEISSDHRCTSPRSTDHHLLYTWAAGVSQPILLPDDVSYPMNFLAYGVEVHYDNVDLDENKFDSSGARLYYTTKPRAMAAASMPVGDVLIALDGQSIGKGLTKQTFSCPSDCTKATFQGDEPVTVYATRYHMHEYSVKATNRILRDGQIVHQSSVEFWDFNQNGGLLVQEQPFKMYPGDQIETTCYVNSPDENYTWGESSQQEMCVVYLYYYPKQTIMGFQSICNVDFILPQCSSPLSNTSLIGELELDRPYDRPPQQCPAPLEYERLPIALLDNEESAANRYAMVYMSAILTMLVLGVGMAQ